MVVVLAGVLASVLLDLPERGVAVVGSIASGLPPFGLPELRLADYVAIVADAVGIALVGFAEGLAAAQTYAAKAGYDIDPDRELLAVGAANVGAEPVRRDGGQRQPVQDRRQRRRRGTVSGLRAGRRPR